MGASFVFVKNSVFIVEEITVSIDTGSIFILETLQNVILWRLLYNTIVVENTFHLCAEHILTAAQSYSIALQLST